MGGVSNADFDRESIDGRRCVRMTGDVTRDSGGGFVQMALYLNGADASRWQTVRIPWDAFEPNSVAAAIDTSKIERIGLLGWMRGFTADLAVAQIAVYA
jgi:hypothetical protein